MRNFAGKEYFCMGLFSKLPAPSVGDFTLQLDVNRQQMERMELRSSFFPAEWWPQSAMQLTWPHAGTDWAQRLDEVTQCYVRMAYEISSVEPLLIATPEPQAVGRLLQEKLPRRAMQNIIFLSCPTNDTWARDHGFLTVITEKSPELLDFRFNGWGNKFEAALDNAINRRLWESGLLHGRYTDCLDFVLEGGSIETDGRGTLLTTAQCLLSENRNQPMSRMEIEEFLCRRLHCRRVLWLEHGHLEGDDTDGHIDTLARFCPGDTIAYVQCTDPEDSHHAALHLMEQELQALRTEDGLPYRLLPLPLPDALHDEDGQRLPATYANFLILNGKVLMPTYNQPEKDAQALHILQQAFPKHEIVGIDSRILVWQHGSIHCSAMQYPKGVF